MLWLDIARRQVKKVTLQRPNRAKTKKIMWKQFE
jgi:hypothetical protein